MHALTLSLLLLPASTLASFNLLSLPGQDGLPEVSNTTTPNDACIAAYNATIDCDPSIVTNSFGSDDLPTAAQLDTICTDTCLNSLRKWVRGSDGCAGEEFLQYFGLTSDTFFDGLGNFTTADVQQYYITAAYHSKCLININQKQGESKYCILTEYSGFTQPSYLNTSNPDALCKDNTCGTQSAYLWAPVKTIYEYDPNNRTSAGEDNNLPMLSLEEACPGIDTSKYPQREADITAAQLGGSSTTGGGNNNGGNSTSTDDKPNAAVGVVVERMSVILAAAVGVVAYLAL
ncbi:hypothetical protein H072_530 [Dactylellina haptotyla CBS 200.50]|uniref:Uncharacterized protein n=1 Tax=Dactylellina haptotyla (strain CBS 200.50) TaxID=1284197 RepID=S8ARB1_DACHA|nr:hypothetical protein H072_530 [Dactylellina haptotyla CBS 200.50]